MSTCSFELLSNTESSSPSDSDVDESKIRLQILQETELCLPKKANEFFSLVSPNSRPSDDIKASQASKSSQIHESLVDHESMELSRLIKNMARTDIMTNSHCSQSSGIQMPAIKPSLYPAEKKWPQCAEDGDEDDKNDAHEHGNENIQYAQREHNDSDAKEGLPVVSSVSPLSNPLWRVSQNTLKGNNDQRSGQPEHSQDGLHHKDTISSQHGQIKHQIRSINQKPKRLAQTPTKMMRVHRDWHKGGPSRVGKHPKAAARARSTVGLIVGQMQQVFDWFAEPISSRPARGTLVACALALFGMSMAISVLTMRYLQVLEARQSTVVIDERALKAVTESIKSASRSTSKSFGEYSEKVAHEAVRHMKKLKFW